jgi:uncharacterized protein YfaS (alpha-2-macroglobulin family)
LPTNTVVRTKVPVSDVLGGPAERGPFAIGIRYDSGRTMGIDEGHSIAQVTDLAITAKVSRAGTLVWVTKLSDASVVADAEVKIRRKGEPGVVKKTDGQGFVSFSPTEYHPAFQEDKAIVFVTSGNDKAFKRLGDSVQNWDFSSAEDAAFGMMFTDRGIYRPGDMVRVKGIVRQELWNGTATPGAGHKVRIEVSAPTGDKIVSLERTLTEYGTFSVDVAAKCRRWSMPHPRRRSRTRSRSLSTSRSNSRSVPRATDPITRAENRLVGRGTATSFSGRR